MALQVWLPLTKDLRNQGVGQVTVTNNGATYNSTNGKLGGAYTFDGSDDFISLTGTPLYNTIKGGSNPFTIAMWIYRADATRAILFGDYSLSGAINCNLELTTDHKVRFYWGGSPDKTFSVAVTQSGWTHIALTYDGATILCYKNGVLQTDKYSGALSIKNKTSGAYYLGRDSRTGTTAFNGRLNDVRIYNDCLSAEEIKEISKGLIVHYQLTGTPLTSQYDHTIYTEPDGSLWTRVFHHNNPANARFESTDSFSTGVYKDADRWYDIEGISSLVTKWEYMVKQKTTSSASEVKYRWTQTKNPLNATWTDVQPTAVTRITTTGYTNGTFGGLYKQGSNTRMVIANATNGNWYGATGSWTAYQNGIPGYPNTVITTGYMDIYIRIDNNISNIEYDCSGLGNNGTKNGTYTYSTSAPKYKTSTTATGSASTYLVGPVLPAEAKTVSLWIKCANKSSNGAIFNDKTSGLQIGLLNSLLYINSVASTAGFTTTHWVDGGWNHVVAINNGGTRSLYVNGEAETQSGAANWYIHNADNCWLWNRSYNNNYPFTGSLSDLRVYATVLSVNDIKSLYQNEAYVDSNGVVLGPVR